MVCGNPLLAEERARKREALLAATEAALERIAQATRRTSRQLRGGQPTALRVGRELHRFKVGRHFRDDKATAEPLRSSVVAPAQRSDRAQRKAQTRQTPDGLPVHSIRTLLADLATLTKNQVRWPSGGGLAVDMLATPTPLQQRAFDLLGVSPNL